uniref:Trypsin inhibitor 2 n=1 Tax=Momordica cochinchinensis TaxID=3674 RepID=ITR2_MOMCO|nr:RecName: Full=Trypsin inhibitor 2; AltName: Full=MCoTI-II; AltName: Full=Trypsin inhibitor II [Momordica cochinchinensis]1HA9_A Chain A, TRYPSIN INHIBITOR II [Momordica cochinchinensis]1IB9_A Chain A, TRYPSIN INHIBITOR II [Momordica cochinchinensis]4GUX_D Chain D, Trypsin inhibitor 2 [Momordica cochinchinensis]4GUX_E Chain E, Trypsin inhibitor 2 [Momordica cochinchinensis]4GUX_F Chain F, Trypsin inhibitor 2 [Momordica cochinchinensis]
SGSDGGVCPKILKKCRRDSDCPGACICRGNGYCG